MIHLMIRHRAKPGYIGELKDATTQCLNIWRRHGCNILGAWNNWIGDESDEVIHIFQFKDFAEYEDIDVKAHNDPEWKDFVNRIRGCSAKRTTELLRPTEFSPLK